MAEAEVKPPPAAEHEHIMQDEENPKPSVWRRKLRVAAAAVTMTNVKARKFENGEERVAFQEAMQEEHKHGELPSWLTFFSSKWHHWSEEKFEGMGYWIGTNPFKSLLLGTLVLISGVPGTFMHEELVGSTGWFLWMRFEFDPYKTTVDEDSVYFKNYEYVTQSYNGYFQDPRVNALVFSVQPGVDKELMSKEMLGDVADILNEVYYKFQIPVDTGGYANFDSLCYRAGNGQCDTSTQSNILYGLGIVNYSRAVIDQLPDPCTPIPNIFCIDCPGGDGCPTGYEGKYCPQWLPFFNPDPESPEAQIIPESIWNAPGCEDYHPYWSILTYINLSLAIGFDEYVNTTGFMNTNMHGMSLENYELSYNAWKPQSFVMNAGTDPTVLHTRSWEQKLVNYLYGPDRPHQDTIRVSVIDNDGLEQAQEEALQSIIPLFFTVAAVMTMYAVTFLGTQTRTHRGYATQVMHISLGSGIAPGAAVSSVGWLAYFGLPAGNLTACALFLVICVGIDCLFIYTSAMRAVGPDVTSIPLAQSLATAEAAGAITATTATSVVAFLLSSAFSTSIPIIFSFNIVMAVSLTINYISFALIFGAFQVLNERRIAAGKRDGPRKPKPYPSWVDIGTKLRNFVNTKYATAMEHSFPLKLAGFSLLTTFIILAIIFVPKVSLGIPAKWNVKSDSYIVDIFNDAETLMGPEGSEPRLPGTAQMLIENLDMSNYDRLTTFVNRTSDTIEQRADVIIFNCLPAAYLHYWNTWLASNTTAPLQTWEQYIHEAQDKGGAPTFVDAREYLFGRPYLPLDQGSITGAYSDEVWMYYPQEMPKAISCTMALYFPTENTPASIEQAQYFKDMAEVFNQDMEKDCFPCNPTRITWANSPNWAVNVGFDEGVKASTWESIGVCIMGVIVVLIFVLPIHRAFITVINIFLVVLALLTTMAWLDFGYSFVTYAVLTCSIGFCVDYTVEIMHFSSLGAPSDPLKKKMAQALRAAGYDVLHGGTTGFLGVFILYWADAKFIRVFCALMMLMILFGVVYALWCLPSTMIFVDDYIYANLKKMREMKFKKIEADKVLGRVTKNPFSTGKRETQDTAKGVQSVSASDGAPPVSAAVSSSSPGPGNGDKPEMSNPNYVI